MERIDARPTHSHGGYQLRMGRPFPFGATLVPGGINFAVFSAMRPPVPWCLFDKSRSQPSAEIPFPKEFRIGNVFTMIVFDLDFESLEYGFRIDGPWAPKHGHRFDRTKILLDPLAKAISGRDVWGTPPDWNDVYPYRARLVPDDFDWETDRPLEIPFEDLVIYEMHLRGFTAHPQCGVKYPGTFAGLSEKIPDLKSLGIDRHRGRLRGSSGTESSRSDRRSCPVLDAALGVGGEADGRCIS